jgi:tungstate transport system ATP-binding protein
VLDVVLRTHHVSVQADAMALLSDISVEIRAGERIVHAPAVADQALIFQRPPMLARSVLDNVRFVLAARGISEPSRTAQARAALVACDLAGIEARHARVLSGGEQQRLALARAWACTPTLLLADEPTANLAPNATFELERLLMSMHAQGSTLLLTTHNVAQAKRLAQRILFLDGGRIVEDRIAADFFASPQSDAARRYLQAETI